MIMRIERWSPDQKAVIVTAVLSVVAMIAVFAHPYDYRLVAINALLLFHTFFSIRCFSRLIRPFTPTQQGIDLSLVVLYGILLSVKLTPQQYLSVFFVLFVLASSKYWNAPHAPAVHPLFRRKLIVDSIAGGVIALSLLLLKFTPSIDVFTPLVVVYLIGTVYFFAVRPLYPIVEP
ncbi:hypothetical protein HZA86_02515 [Candidatus Uhrbacteria bacterium]|nr:hypothetical protein [Candidatus Uhrbacteria bacterium]